MPDTPRPHHDAVTIPVGVTTICPQCGVMLDAVTTTCGSCGAVVTGAGADSGRGERIRAKLQDAIGDAFVLGDLIGRGGMGIVYRARELSLDRDVALKVLAFDPVLNPDAYARFEREAKLAARLDHPHIVPIFSVGQRAGVAFYTMRMVRGGSVEQLLASAPVMPLDRALSILHDIASALDYAHAHGVVHRDIKPANILIGDSGHALVADFGIARAFGGDAGATTTGTGVIGSPAYMSPEQWRGEKVDGRADQYALGVLAFELLTGRRPFADASMQELLRMHLTDDPPDIVSLRGDLPSHTADAVWHAMAKDPADRFVSATAFVDALGGDARPRPLPARRPSRIPTRMSPAGVAPIPSRAPTRKLPTPAAPRRSPWLVIVLLLLLGGVAGAIMVTHFNRAVVPPVAVVPPPVAAPSPLADSIAALQRSDADENARLQREVSDARHDALAAEHKVELLSQAVAAKSAAAAAEPPHAHIVVIARGGAPRVLVDGKATVNNAPTVVEVAPGRHSVTVLGANGNQFKPPQYTLDLAPNDTQQVIFVSVRAAQMEARRKRFLQQSADSFRKAKRPPG